MGEYIKHPKLSNDIKIGIFIEGFWETYLPKKLLEEMKFLGFKDYYAGKFVENGTTLDEFIEHYDKFNTSFVDYKEVMQVSIDEEYFELLKNELLDEDICLVLYKDEKEVIITDKRYSEEIKQIVNENDWGEVEIIEYEYSVERAG